MATFSHNNTQGITEVRTYTVDYSGDLITGGTVTAGTATHTPPSGGTILTPTVTVDSPYLYVTLPELTITGLHYLDVLATFSNSDKSAVRLAINGVFPTPTARAGTEDIITQLRSMCAVGVNDYSIVGIPYWSDAQLQTVLDRYRTDVYQRQLYHVDENISGALSITHYAIGDHFIESGANFTLYDKNFTAVTTGFSVDYPLGLVTFTSDTAGATYYATYRTYDINRAAADVWRQKASHCANMFDFKAGNQSVNKSVLIKQALEMAAYYSQIAGARSIDLERMDT